MIWARPNLSLIFFYFSQISGFGLSKWMEYIVSHTASTTAFATPTHIPREKWKNNEMESNVNCDVYSFGILLWEHFANKKPSGNSPQGNFELFCTFENF